MTLRLGGGEEEKGTGRGDGRNKRQCGTMMKHKYTDWRDEHRHYVWFAKPHIAEQQGEHSMLLACVATAAAVVYSKMPMNHPGVE